MEAWSAKHDDDLTKEQEKWLNVSLFCKTCKESYAFEAISDRNCTCEYCGLWFWDDDDRERHALTITEMSCERGKNWHDDCPIPAAIVRPSSPPPPPPRPPPTESFILKSVPETPSSPPDSNMFSLVLWTKISFLCENCCETWCDRQVSWQNEQCKSCHKWFWDFDHLKEHLQRVVSGFDPAGHPDDICDPSFDHSCAKF